MAVNESVHHVEFRLNRSVRKVTVMLSWLDQSRPLTFELGKDGRVLQIANKQTVLPTASITTLPFPLYQPGPSSTIAEPSVSPLLAASSRSRGTSTIEATMQPRILPGPGSIEAEGEYRLTIRRMFPSPSEDVPFHLMVLADDNDLEVELVLPRQVYYTDQRIPIDIEILDGGRPLDGVFGATAEVTRPTISFGNLYADHHRQIIDRLDPTKVVDPSGPYQAVVAEMLQDDAIVEQLRTRERDVVRLDPASRANFQRTGGPRGVYRARYAATRVPGHYRIEAKVRGVSPTAGVFERVVGKTVLVLPRPDPEQSKIRTVVRTKNRELVTTMVPADRHGNLLGPGFGSQVVFSLEDEMRGTVRDNQDGSYELRVDLGEDVKRVKEPLAAALWIAGERVFSGPFPKLIASSAK